MNEQLERIHRQQLQVHWVNYIHERFSDRENATDMRRLRLMIDLSEATTQPEAFIPLSQLRHLSPRIAEVYAGKSDKTLQRDLQTLEEMNVLVRTPKGVRAKRELMLAFLPHTLAV